MRDRILGLTMVAVAALASSPAISAQTAESSTAKTENYKCGGSACGPVRRLETVAAPA